MAKHEKPAVPSAKPETTDRAPREPASPVCYGHLFEDGNSTSRTMQPPGEDPIRYHPEQRRFSSASGAVLDYEIAADGRFIFTHTEVPVALRGRGLAVRLTAAALAHARKEGREVEARCDYVAAYFKRHAIDASKPARPCVRCGRETEQTVGDMPVCDECYVSAGSCCPEFGGGDLTDP